MSANALTFQFLFYGIFLRVPFLVRVLYSTTNIIENGRLNKLNVSNTH